jgi:hypothetical protein
VIFGNLHLFITFFWRPARDDMELWQVNLHNSNKIFLQEKAVEATKQKEKVVNLHNSIQRKQWNPLPAPKENKREAQRAGK